MVSMPDQGSALAHDDDLYASNVLITDIGDAILPDWERLGY